VPSLMCGVRRRVTSPHLQSLMTLALGSLLGLSACTAAPKIDGTSDVSFRSSHSRLVGALTPQERLKLSLAEAIMLAPLGCATLKPIHGKPELTRILDGESDFSTCRKELNGMTYNSIMKRAYAKH
jgi:hypothetical protein